MPEETKPPVSKHAKIEFFGAMPSLRRMDRSVRRFAMTTEETKPVEREGFERWARTYNLTRSPSGVEYEWAEAAWQASADAALERAAALLEEEVDEEGGYPNGVLSLARWLAEQIRALKGRE